MLSALRAAAFKAPRAPSVLKYQMPTIAAMTFRRGWCDSAAEVSVEGTVKWWDSKKGFGFITPNDGGADVFVHQTEVHAPGFRSLADGEAVEFKTETQEDGRLRAREVTGPEGNYVQGAPAPDLDKYH